MDGISLKDGSTYFFDASSIIRDNPLPPVERNSWRLLILDLGVEFDELSNVLRTLYKHVSQIRFDVGLDSQCCSAPEDVAPVAQAVGNLLMQVCQCLELENPRQITYQTTPDILSNDSISITPKNMIDYLLNLRRV